MKLSKTGDATTPASQNYVYVLVLGTYERCGESFKVRGVENDACISELANVRAAPCWLKVASLPLRLILSVLGHRFYVQSRPKFRAFRFCL